MRRRPRSLTNREVICVNETTEQHREEERGRPTLPRPSGSLLPPESLRQAPGPILLLRRPLHDPLAPLGLVQRRKDVAVGVDGFATLLGGGLGQTAGEATGLAGEDEVLKVRLGIVLIHQLRRLLVLLGGRSTLCGVA